MRCSLIFNVDSGSYSPPLCESLTKAVRAHGELDHVYRLPEENLPTRQELERRAVDMVAIYTGDGTINALVQQLGDWRGRILVLPGGTMNLLSRRLHGDQEALSIMDKAMAGDARSFRIPMAEAAGRQALVGIIAGPTSALGQVREDMRHFNLAGLLDSVPDAWQQTFGGEQVKLAGSSENYPAIYAQAESEGIHLMGFTATTMADVFGHGLAWLHGDFRDGPRDELGTCTTCTIESSASTIGLLVDGEQAEVNAPMNIRWTQSRLDFISTINQPRQP